MLARQGLVRLRRVYEGSGLAAVVGHRRIFFDVQDDASIALNELRQADAYYKRSYSRALFEGIEGAHRIRPLGLNYEVYPDHLDVGAVPCALRLGETLRGRIASSLKALKLTGSLTRRVSGMKASPAPDQEPRALFLTRTWEPDGWCPANMPSRDEINDMRAECVIAIRRELGERALAGFAPSALAQARYPALIVPSTARRAYIDQLRQYPVCITTTGLHGSIGWKMGEYVAFSKAIVSERLNYAAPGFEAGANYLEFWTADECVAAIGRLFDDRPLRRRIMEKNARYYQDYLRPDRLVWRTLS